MKVRSTENFIDAVCGVPLKAAEHMAVNIQCQNHGAVAEAFLYNLWVYASGEKKRSGCMPEVVETNSVKTSPFAQRPPEPPSEIVLPDGSALGI